MGQTLKEWKTLENTLIVYIDAVEWGPTISFALAFPTGWTKNAVVLKVVSATFLLVCF